MGKPTVQAVVVDVVVDDTIFFQESQLPDRYLKTEMWNILISHNPPILDKRDAEPWFAQ